MINYDELSKGKKGYQSTVKAQSIRPINNRVIVTDMHFGEQTTQGGIILTSDDGKDRGIKPRWGKVFAKGPENDDPYNEGDWILVEHGRWTRGFDVELEGFEEAKTMRMVEAESILMWSDEEPQDMLWGDKEGAGPSESINPENFVRA